MKLQGKCVYHVALIAGGMGLFSNDPFKPDQVKTIYLLFRMPLKNKRETNVYHSVRNGITNCQIQIRFFVGKQDVCSKKENGRSEKRGKYV